jgi:hypothetical protein
MIDGSTRALHLYDALHLACERRAGSEQLARLTAGAAEGVGAVDPLQNKG